jgi:hypothetical protein
MPVPTRRDQIRAAEALWGDAGTYVYRTFDELNRQHFRGELPGLPVVIGITPYGRCLGLTRYGPGLPRITIASNQFKHAHVVRDVLLHEMLHAHLALTGAESKHNAVPWCEAIVRLSPAVLGHDIQAAPVKARRIDGKVVKAPRDGHLPQGVLARWPGALRPPGWDAGPAIPVASC